MKYFVFIISFLFSNNLLSQKIEYKIYFLEDSIKIGNPITLISTLNYPETIELIQPDSSYNFMSFDFIRKKIFPSLIKKNRVYDSTVYFLRTFEIDSIQKVYLNALILDKNDSIKISSNEDSISLIYQVEDIESRAKENTLLSTIKSIFNSEKLFTYFTIFIISLIFIYMIFRKKIKRYFEIRSLKNKTKKFNSDFESILDQYEINKNINDLERLLLLWKRFKEKLTNKPYLSSTTNEISLFLKKKDIIKILQEIDENLYSNNKDYINSNKLNKLQIEANNTSYKEIKKIGNGK